MRRTLLLLAFFALVAACNTVDRLALENLQQSMDELQRQVLPGVPAADGIVTPASGDFAITFDKLRYGVDAGGNVTINYSLQQEANLEVSANEGWEVSLAQSGLSGSIVITAPDPASPVSFAVTATTPDGRKAAAAIPLMVRDPYSAATRPIFKTLGYRGPKNHMATAETFQKIAEAGINILTVETDEGPFMHQLDLAVQFGMKCMPVVWPYAEAYDRDPENYTGLDEIINQLKDHPATFAYHIYDEPSVTMIPSLRLRKEKIESLDPNHPVYINLGPDASAMGLGVYRYSDYIEQYIRDCGVKFISYDMYPCRPDNDPDYPDGIVSYWWKCNEIVADLTKQYGIPWWGFAASCWIDKETHLFAKPTLENLRLQVYTNLAYGAQVIQYFTLLQYGGTDFAPLMLDGTWSGAYDILKEFNAELHRRGWVFDGCRVEKVRHAGQLPAWTQSYSNADLPPEIGSLSTDKDALVSFLENNGNKYITVANKSLKEKMTLSAIFNDAVYTIARDGLFAGQQPGPAQFTLDEGDMLVIKYR